MQCDYVSSALNQNNGASWNILKEIKYNTKTRRKKSRTLTWERNQAYSDWLNDITSNLIELIVKNCVLGYYPWLGFLKLWIRKAFW